MSELNEIRAECSTGPPTPSCSYQNLLATENAPIEYFSRFSLFVLDLVRKLQKNSVFEQGVEKCHIIEYLKHQPFVDGDIASQVSSALQDLENYGYLMHFKNGYKTLGPFAKLCLSKTPRARRFQWRKLELKLYKSSSDVISSFSCLRSNNIKRKNRRSRSEPDFQINEEENCSCPDEIEGY